MTASQAAVIATEPRLIDRVGNDIGGGAVAADMLRPASVVGFRIAAETGKGLMRLACAGVVGALLVSLVAGSPPNWGAALLAVPSAVVAVACHVVAQHAYAAAEFWFNEAKAAWSLFQKLVFVDPVHPLATCSGAGSIRLSWEISSLDRPCLRSSATPPSSRTAVYVLGSLCGAVVLVSFLVALGSVMFFAGGQGEQGELGFQAILIFAAYPLDVFGGLTKIVLFTAVPAAFVTGVPSQLVDEFSRSTAAVLVAVPGVGAALAWTTFHEGLRRYRSGALWTRA